MPKLVSFMHLSLDGFAADTQHQLNFFTYDTDLQQYADKAVQTVGTAIYGRTTYQLMESFWPQILKNPQAAEREKLHAEWVQQIPKIVCSQSLQSADWNNTRLIRSDVHEEFLRLKQQPGKDLVIFGSPGLTAYLMNMQLIDEFKFTIHPIILGTGLHVFSNNKQRHQLQLLEMEKMPSGVITAHYTQVL
jgi:dihydrofolate reductase